VNGFNDKLLLLTARACVFNSRNIHLKCVNVYESTEPTTEDLIGLFHTISLLNKIGVYCQLGR
jgi:hypothetical protein